MKKVVIALALLIVSFAAGVEGAAKGRPKRHAAARALPRPDHIVIVFEENKAPGDLTSTAPYIIGTLKTTGATLSLYAFHHPSQPNYYEIFAGTNVLDIGPICNDSCPARQSTQTNNLYRAMHSNPALSFAGYAEDLPTGLTPAQIVAACSTSCHDPCTQCYFALKHTPWMVFAEIPPSATKPFSSFPTTPAGFAQLPTVSLVTPNLIHDMHSVPGAACGQDVIPTEVKNGDRWLKDHLAAYAAWAMTHNSLLIVTWDESSTTDAPAPTCPSARYQPPANQIATFVVGQSVKSGYVSTAQYNHWDLLNTILQMYALPAVNNSANAKVIDDIWK